MKSKGWKKEDQPSKILSFDREENFYGTLSKDEEQLEEKFEKMEVVEEDDKEMKSKEELTQQKKKDVTIRTGRRRI